MTKKDQLQGKGKTTSFSLKKTAVSLGTYGTVPASAAAEPTDGSKDYTRFNFICNKDLVKKVRDISRIEGVSIRKIMEKAIAGWITKYEEKNGPVGNMRERSIEEL